MIESRPVRDRVRDALTTAVRERDRVATTAYRSALAALDNAAAVDVARTPPPAPDVHIAGAAAGAYATDVPRRQLTEAEQRAVLLAEIVERRRAADDFAGAGRPTDALRLWAEADLLQVLLAQ